MHYIISGFLFAIGVGIAYFILDILDHCIGDLIRKKIIKIEKKIRKINNKNKGDIVVTGFYRD